jgi:hypothetical protein
MFKSRYISCDDCGASVARAESGGHECDPERLLDYRIFHLSGEIGRFEDELGAYLDSPRGRFESWYAEHRRRESP